jgi:hypothetical protein
VVHVKQRWRIVTYLFKYILQSFVFLQGTSTAVEEHVQSSLHEHLKLVSKLAQDQKEQLESQQLEQQKQSLLIQQLTDTVNNLEKLVREQNKATHSQEKTVHTLKDQIKDQRKQSQRFEREITNQIQALNQSPTRPLPTNLCVAEYVWPIKNFRRRLRRIQEGEIDDPLISEPFYTGVYGYKLSIWVYLNGRGKTLGDWVSVFARVMPSDHDNILSWPVRPMYTFTLLDQSEGEKDHIVRKRKVNDIKRDGGKHHGIHRPEGGERSVIVGFDDFVAHAQLEKRKFVVEDCIYLKLEANITH